MVGQQVVQALPVGARQPPVEGAAGGPRVVGGSGLGPDADSPVQGEGDGQEPVDLLGGRHRAGQAVQACAGLVEGEELVESPPHDHALSGEQPAGGHRVPVPQALAEGLPGEVVGADPRPAVGDPHVSVGGQPVQEDARLHTPLPRFSLRSRVPDRGDV